MGERIEEGGIEEILDQPNCTGSRRRLLRSPVEIQEGMRLLF